MSPATEPDAAAVQVGPDRLDVAQNGSAVPGESADAAGPDGGELEDTGEHRTISGVEPGLRLAGRYLVEELLLDDVTVRSFRAVDEVLGRSVLVQTLDADDPRSEPLITAARAAALASDARFLRVLDVSVQDGSTYLIREWMGGTRLGALLADAGPLPAREAGAMAREVAEAMASAHEQGLYHLRIDPDMVILGRDGTVKITGLATQAVLYGAAGGTDPGFADTRAIGALLYASLTGRWPHAAGYGLRAAPVVDGRLPSPRQVRAGVPRLLDEITDRTVGQPPRHEASPILAAADLASALSGAVPLDVRQVASARTPSGQGDDPPHPALLPNPLAVDVTPRPAPLTLTAAAPARRRRPLRLLVVSAGMLLVVGGALFGLQLLMGSPRDPATPPGSVASPTSVPQGGAVPIVGAQSFDPPPGNGDENPTKVGLAIDGNLATSWSTMDYYDPLELQKPGVGLILDLGRLTDVRSIQLQLELAGADVELRVAPDRSVAPVALEDWKVVAARAQAPTSSTLEATGVQNTRYVLVWFTKLPKDGANYRDAISEVSVQS